jgi:hypothetical protein
LLFQTGKADKVFGDEDRVEEEENAELRATYEYFDGHWKPYAEDAHGIVEAAFKDWLADKEVDSRPVKSGEFIYMINFDEWTQQNAQVPPHTVRQIRRCIGGVAQANVASPKKAKKPVPAEPEEEPEIEEDEEKPKKRPAKKAAAKPKKRGKKQEEEEEEEEEDKPKKRAATKKAAAPKKSKKNDDDEEEEQDEEEEDKPKKRPAAKKAAEKNAPAKKAAPKPKKSKKNDDDDDEQEQDEEEDKPKKRPAAKKAAEKNAPAKKAKGGAGSAVFDGLVFCITGKLSQVRIRKEALVACLIRFLASRAFREHHLGQRRLGGQVADQGGDACDHVRRREGHGQAVQGPRPGRQDPQGDFFSFFCLFCSIAHCRRSL